MRNERKGTGRSGCEFGEDDQMVTKQGTVLISGAQDALVGQTVRFRRRSKMAEAKRSKRRKAARAKKAFKGPSNSTIMEHKAIRFIMGVLFWRRPEFSLCPFVLDAYVEGVHLLDGLVVRAAGL